MTIRPRMLCHPRIVLACLFCQVVLFASLSHGQNVTAAPADIRQSPAKESKTNVLIIAIDDLNDWVGFLQGHPQIKTPNMDRLAKRGTIFANAHCAAPLCCPSRAALFSGLQPFRTGIYNNDQNILKLRPDVEMLSQMFVRQGYLALGTGKLLHSGGTELYDNYFRTEQRWSPFQTGRDVNYPLEELDRKPTNPRYTVRLGNESIVLPLNGMPSDRNPTGANGESFDWGPMDVTDDRMGDGQITDWAMEQLRTMPDDQPFFLAVGYYRPHIPLWAPKKYFDLYAEQTTILPESPIDDLDDLSQTGQRWAVDAVTAGSHKTVVEHHQWQAAVRAYLACVTFVDAQIGRLLDELDRSTHRDDTLVVLFSDHGWHLGEKQHWGKWTGWERATRVPLVIVPPRAEADSYRTGATCLQPAGLIDLYPTLIEMCGFPAREDLDGSSLVPSLKDPSVETGPVITTFDFENYSVRDERWRLIHYQDGSEELYDHHSDPHEWKNLIGDPQFANVRQKLSQRIPQSPAPSIR